MSYWCAIIGYGDSTPAHTRQNTRRHMNLILIILIPILTVFIPVSALASYVPPDTGHPDRTQGSATR